MVPIGLPMLMRACSTRIWQPVAPYACKVHRLVVNGQAVPLSRPCVAVIDTGTTGLVISDSLYNSDELPLPGAAMRHVGVEGKPRRAAIAPRARHPYSLSACPPPRVAVLTERGRVVRFGAARKPKAQPAALTSTASAGGGAPRGSAGTAEPFPLIVTPVPLPWFEPEVDTFYQRGKGKVAGAAGAAGAAAEAKAARKRLRKRVPSAELGSAPHVLFLGLAFMADMRLTIDTDAQRLSAEHLVPSNFEPVVFGGPPNPTRVA